MTKLTLIIGGIIIGFGIASSMKNMKDNDNIPEFYWNDRVVPPHNGFELKVDMYWNETKDTIYMEYSSGPEGE